LANQKSKQEQFSGNLNGGRMISRFVGDHPNVLATKKIDKPKIPVVVAENYNSTAGPIVSKHLNFPNQRRSSIESQNKKRDSVLKKTLGSGTPGFRKPSISLRRLTSDLNKSEGQILPIVQLPKKSIRRKSMISSKPIEIAQQAKPDPLGLSQYNSTRIKTLQLVSFDLDHPDEQSRSHVNENPLHRPSIGSSSLQAKIAASQPSGFWPHLCTSQMDNYGNGIQKEGPPPQGDLLLEAKYKD
jgi:hypothetical protein